MSNDSTLYTRASGIEVHETDDGLIVFNATTDKVHHLNPTAGVLFELCTEPKTSAQLAQEMVDLFSLDEEPAEAIQAGLDQLVSEDVLIISQADE